MTMYYYTRNMDNINKLADNTKATAKNCWLMQRKQNWRAYL